MRWIMVFLLAAVLAGMAGVRSSVPTATAQDYRIINQDGPQSPPVLQERPIPRVPMQGPGMGPMGPMPMMQPAAAMWGDDKAVYVLRGDWVYKLDKENLRVRAKVQLPMERPNGPGGPMPEGFQPPPPDAR